MAIEQDQETHKITAKVYNPAEANKQRAIDEEEAPVQSLVTASMMAAQNQDRKSKGAAAGAQEGAGGYLLANSISQGNDISPSFQQTGVPQAAAAGGPMTFEPGSLM